MCQHRILDRRVLGHGIPYWQDCLKLIMELQVFSTGKLINFILWQKIIFVVQGPVYVLKVERLYESYENICR